MNDPAPPPDPAHRAIETAVRTSYGRLVAYLAARWGDVTAVEDALSDALLAALRTWPLEGVPDKPEAWLLAVARRKLIDHARHASVKRAAADTLAAETATALSQSSASVVFPDERLSLLFVCTHPAIAEDVRTPQMLQTVLGLDAVRIGAAFLVTPSTMGQRLSRAKTKIRDARIRFYIPEAVELPARLDCVLEAIYAAYGTGWDNLSGADPRSRGLSTEALELGRLVVEQLPGEPEAHGLLALMLHCEARRDARLSETGAYVPISQQDPLRWSAFLQQEAEAQLRQASRAGRIGRFQLEAPIQSAHAQRAHSAHVGRAAAIAEAQNALAGLNALDQLPAELVTTYQPFWALRATLLKRLDRRGPPRQSSRPRPDRGSRCAGLPHRRLQVKIPWASFWGDADKTLAVEMRETMPTNRPRISSCTTTRRSRRRSDRRAEELATKSHERSVLSATDLRAPIGASRLSLARGRL